MKANRSGFFRKFVLVMIFLSVVPLALMGVRAVMINKKLSKNVESISSDSLETAILDKQNRLSEWMAGSVDDYFSAVLRNIPKLSDASDDAGASFIRKEKMLIDVYNGSREFLSIALLDAGFNPYIIVPREWKYEKEEAAKIVSEIARGRFAFGDVYFYNDLPVVDFVYKTDRDKYIYAAVDLGSILDKIKSTPSQIGEEVFAVSPTGKIILHPDTAKMTTMKDISFILLIKEFISSKSSLSKGDFNGINNIPMIGAISMSRITGWGVVVWQTKTTAYAQVARVKNEINAFSRQLITYTYIQILVICLIAFSASFLLAKSISRPIIALTRAAARVSRRDFTEPVKVKSKDEIGQLAGIFNQMMDELNKFDRMQADKLDALVYSIKDGLIMIDHNENIIMANARSRQILFLDDKCLGLPLVDTLKEPALKESVRELLSSHEENPKTELDLSKDDVPKYYEADKYSVTTREDVNLGSIITLRDITLEKELSKMKEDFLHSITHDLRSPMTSIRGFLEILLDESMGSLNDDQKNFLKIVDESSEKLLTMINNLLDVSKLEAGKMVLNFGKVDFNKLAKTVTDFFYPQAKSQKVDLQFCPSGVINAVSADENLMERVITNLVSNAMKFTPAGGSVTVLVEDNAPDENKLRVSVKDTGKGIPADEVERVFEKFHQVADTALKKTGTGLGLTVSKYIVECHLGKIKAESVFGKGSTFSFWIPKTLVKENGVVRAKDNAGRPGA